MAERAGESANAGGSGFPDVLSCGRVRGGEGPLAPGARALRGWVLAFTARGKAGFSGRGDGVPIGEGDVALFEPGFFRPGRLECRKGWEFFWASFIPRVGWHMHISDWPRPAPGLRRIPLGDSPAARRVQDAFLRLLDDSEHPGRFSHFLFLNAVGEVLLRATDHHRRTSGAAAPSPPIRKALEHISRAYARPLDVALLARVSSLSPSRFAHRFKEELGAPVMDYILRFRLSRAARLLEGPSNSAKQIAALCGFGTPSFFARQFRRMFSMTPIEYRARMKAPAGPRATGAPPA